MPRSDRADVDAADGCSGRSRLVLPAVAFAAVILLGLGAWAAVALNVGADSVTPQAPPPGAPRAAEPTLGAGVPVIRVTPGGRGDGRGPDWSGAAAIDDLPRLLAEAAPGTQVLLRADTGPFQLTSPIQIAHGGSAGSPIVIRGVDSSDTPQAATITGGRVNPYRPDGPPGVEGFRLLTGADNLVFQDLDFRDVGNGCIRVGGTITNLTIRRTTATNVRRFLETSPSGGQTATVAGLRISDVTATGYSRAFARLAGDTHDVVIENVRGDAAGQDGDPFAQGVDMQDTVHGVLVRDVSMSNAIDTTSGGYWNGDGFSAEEKTYDLRFERTRASGNTDAGYDLKSQQATLIDATAVDNKRNFRFWGNITVESCTGENPRLRGGTGTQDQVHATRNAVVAMTRCTFGDADPKTIVFDVDGSARLTVIDSTVAHAPGGRLQSVVPPGVLETPGLRLG